MPSRVHEHVRTNVVGYVAIFLFCIGGTASAIQDGPLAGTDQVGSADIIDGEVYSADVHNGQITSADVRDDTLNAGGLASADIANAALTGQDLADDSIGSSDVAGIWTPDVIEGGLNGGDIQNGSLTGLDVADNSINADDVFGLRGNDDIQNSSLTGLDVLDQSLTGSDIEDNTVNADDVHGLGSNEINDGSLRSADVLDDSLAGADIREDTLDFGCQTGMIKGFALVAGSSAIPNDSWSADNVHGEYNCTGRPVVVRDLIELEGEVGRYSVLFEGLNPQVAIATPSIDSLAGAESDKDNFISVGQISGSGPSNDLWVTVHDSDESAEHGWFYIVVM